MSTIFISLVGLVAFASPSTLTYQGRILKSNGSALEYNNVTFLFEITSEDGLCVYYREQKNGINMANSKGVFDVSIGSGTKLFPTSGTVGLKEVFDNSVTLDCGDINNNVSGTKGPIANQARRLRVQFHDGTGWQLITPDNEIRSVPFSHFASSALKLGTYSATDFVQVTRLPSAACSAGQVVFFDGTNFSCVTDAGGAGVISDVLAGTGITVTGTSSKTVAANFGTTAGTIAQGNDSRIAGAFQTSTILGGDLSGTLPNPAVAGLAGTAISITSLASGNVLRYNGTNWVNASLSSAHLSNDSDLLKASNMPANCAANQTLTFSSPTGTWVCSNISGLNANTITAGTIDSARLPASATYWSSATGGINYSGGNVGIGVATPNQKLSVAGTIESTTGGFRFPDGTVQTTAMASGSSPIYSVRVATANGWPGTLSGIQTIDGVSLSAGDRVLVNLGNNANNGVWIVSSGAWTRAPELSTWSQVGSFMAMVAEGSFHKGKIFSPSTDAVSGVLGTNSFRWYVQGSNALYGSAVLGIGAGSASGADNSVAIGRLALGGNNSGNHNVAVGSNALQLNTTGSRNTAVGSLSSGWIGAGTDNASLGYWSMPNATVSVGNTAVGSNALLSTVALSESTAVGYMSISNMSSSSTPAVSYNTAIGAYSLQGSGTASANTGTMNTALGHSALQMMKAGSGNIGVGYNAGRDITSGSNNVVIGSNTGSTFATSSGIISINNGAGTERIRVDSTGNVGVGVTSPAAKLDVAGEIKLGNTASTCNSTNEGQQRYNSTSKVMEFCNGTAWTSMSSGASGSVSTQNVVTGSRAFGTTYQNTTGKAMFVAVTLAAAVNGENFVVYSDSNATPTTDVAGVRIYSHSSTVSFYVLPGNYYRLTRSNSGSIERWTEWY